MPILIRKWRATASPARVPGDPALEPLTSTRVGDRTREPSAFAVSAPSCRCVMTALVAELPTAVMVPPLSSSALALTRTPSASLSACCTV